MTPDVPTLMTVAQVARALACSPRRVRQLIGEGKLAALRLTDAGHWRITADSVRALCGLQTERSHTREYYARRAAAAARRLGYERRSR